MIVIMIRKGVLLMKQKIMETNTKFVGAYITNEDFITLQEIAYKQGLDISKLIRKILKDYIQKKDIKNIYNIYTNK